MTTSRQKKMKDLTTPRNVEMTPELELIISEAAKEYLKNSIQQKSDGWDNWWAYCRPSSRHIGSLTKITFDIGKKELSNDELLEKIKSEIKRRLADGDSYFLAGMRSFSEEGFFYRLETNRDHIITNILDSSELTSALEACAEYPAINELFQRIKDYQHDLVTFESTRELLSSFRKKERAL
jgi:hypothetical protein